MQNIKYSKFNILLVLLILIFCFLISFFNWFIDPFYVFQNKLIPGLNDKKANLRQQERLTKQLRFKLDKNKYDLILVGSSRVAYALSPKNVAQISKLKSQNLAITGGSSTTSIEISKIAIISHPEIKHVYFGLDFFPFEDTYSEPNINYSNKITLQELSSVLLSYDAIRASFNTIKASKDININMIYDNDGVDYDNRPNETLSAFEGNIKRLTNAHYKNYKLSTQKLKELEEFKEFCKIHDVELTLFIAPVHISLIYAVKHVGALEIYKNWKKELVQISEVIDFAYPNKYNTEPIKEEMIYYFDSSHYKQALSHKILDKLLLNKGSFGVVLTKDNVDFYNEKMEKQVKKWQKNNKKWEQNIKELVK